MPGVSGKSFTLACVVDKQPRFLVELILWAHCVARFIPRDKFRVIVYFVDEVPRELGGWLASMGIASARSEVMVPASRHCNKIAPLYENHPTDYVLVADVDLFFVSDPSDLFRSSRLRAAPNNGSNPPAWIFKKVFAACGMNFRYRPSFALYPGARGKRETHVNNVSAGIIGVPLPKAPAFADSWRRWANWVVNNRALLDRWAVHVAQVSFCLAAEEMGEDVEFLPPQVNTILQSLDEIDTVLAFHLTSGHIPLFSKLFNADRTMNPGGFSPGVGEAIGALNICIRDAVRDIKSFAATRDHLELFLNPAWVRPDGL